MTLPAPRIDSRTPETIVRQILELLKVYVSEPEWKGFQPDKGASHALIKIFGRFSELIIERLNHVPEKNLLAFLDMLGASQLPPQPARVPLTFSLVNGSIVDGLVPAGTQVAAVPSEGEKTPVVFETEEELVVTAAKLVSLFVRQPERDRYADHSLLINSVSADGVPAFQGQSELEHILYLGHDTLFSYPGIQYLRLQLSLEASQNRLILPGRWEKWDGDGWTEISGDFRPGVVGTDGKKYFTTNSKVFRDFSPFLRQTINGYEKSWLRCRLVQPIVPSTTPLAVQAVHDDQLSAITKINMMVMMGTLPDQTLPVEAAFSNTVQLDTTKDFLPFGERPKVGDTLYLANNRAFSNQGSVVTLNINLTSPKASPGNPQLSWEFWNGQKWEALDKDFSDGTNAFTQAGVVKFTFPEQPVPVMLNGIEGFWIRIRIASGNYGEEAHYKLDETDPSKYAIDEKTKGYIIIPATLKPPSISSITIAYGLTKQAEPEVLLAYNDDFVYEKCSYPFKPFQHKTDTNPTLYMGFSLPQGLAVFPNRKISLYAAMGESRDGEDLDRVSPPESEHAGEGLEGTSGTQPELVWEYSTGASWSELTVRDYSENLTGPGLIEFLAPPDFGERSEFGLSRYWLRVIWKSGEYLFNPRLRGLLLNTVMAAQAVAIKDEVLGSSDGSKHQKFTTTRTPVLEGQQLSVREPEIPSAHEREEIEGKIVGDAFQVIADETGRPREVWVHWSQVPDFYGSFPRDRHYVLDNLTGEVRFGDGQNGLIPPRGTGNIRMSLYKTGGGAVGNRPAGTITQLKTTVPYVDRVVNHLAATGGTDAETSDELLRRAPRILRHGYRAVTVKDYEDMAGLASPEVARARCIPLANIITDEANGQSGADAGDKKLLRNGTVSLIIVPRSAEAQPTPSFELIARVREFIVKWQSPLVELIVVGPKYVGINVTVEVASETMDGAGELKLAIDEALSKYLHPLYGGVDGNGWDFGRYPHVSNLYALIEAIPGVDHVRSLQLSPTADSDEVKQAGSYFLVYSSTHTIKLWFGET